MNSRIGKGRPIRSQTKEVIYNIKTYFNQEKELVKSILPLSQVTKRVSQASGVGLGTVRSVCREGDEAAESGAAFPGETPGKKRPRLSVVLKPDTFALQGIRRKIHSFYLKGVIPSIQKLHKTIQWDARNNPDTEPLFEGSKESLRLVVTKELGFRYKKVDRRKHLLERTDVVASRHAFLRQMQAVNMKDVVFLDETWVNEHHSVSKCWQSSDCSGVKIPSGKGKRLILLHAGTSKGFLPNCMLLFVSNSGLADYHEDMNAEVFTKWFTDQLLPNIPANSTIVMDNAPYHSVQYEKSPNSNSLKKDMQNWLTAQKIPFHDNMLKPELYELIKLYKPRSKKYVIDKIAVDNGHNIIRLPPYHCEFNPIELIWAQVKNSVAKDNTTFKMSDVKVLTANVIHEVTAENWLKVVEHTKKEMDEYLENDPVIDIMLEPLIISINGADDSESDTDSDKSEDSIDSSFEDSFQSID